MLLALKFWERRDPLCATPSSAYFRLLDRGQAMNDQEILDSKKFIGKLVEKHGIRIDEKDPAFYVVLLNKYALEDAVKEIIERIQRAGADFEGAAERVQQRAGQFFAQQIKESSVMFKQEGQVIVAKPAIEWLAVGVLAALLIFMTGILVGIGLKW
jgi:hypothetical protein